MSFCICFFFSLFQNHIFVYNFGCRSGSRQSLETAIYPRPHRQQYPFILTPNRAQKFVFRPFSSNFALSFSLCLLFLVRFLPIKIGRLRTFAERKWFSGDLNRPYAQPNCAAARDICCAQLQEGFGKKGRVIFVFAFIKPDSQTEPKA